MIVRDICSALENIAPLHLAAEWDNVGLLVGSREWDATKVLLTIDLTPAVLDEAVRDGEQMIVAYHPPIFHAIKSVTDADVKQSVILRAARAGIALYSPHTALDAAPGGMNDWLAEGLGEGDVRALQMHPHLPASEQTKIVTFCPAEAVERIRNGLATIGAGHIGKYELCSFEITGAGSFLGGEDTNPAVGVKGTLQRVNEVRLEMVCPKAALGLAVMMLRQFHPYEEPPIEIYELLPRPQRSSGQGRRLVLDKNISLKSLADRVKKHLGVKSVMVAEATPPPSSAPGSRPKTSGAISSIGMCAGAGADLVNDAIAQGCQVFLTGEMRHHEVLAAQARGCTIILAGHTNTERGYLPRLKDRLAKSIAGVAIRVSRSDEEVLREM